MSSASGNPRGRFVVLDGIDGCGKSTQARRLVEAWTSEGGEPPLHLREPGSTAVGERLRALLLDPELELSAEVETLLFAAARRAMLDELVEPALAAGRDVVCERFHASTFAYQAAGGGVAESELLELLERWADSPRPDLVILLDLSVEESLGRRSGARDRIEARGEPFHVRVAEGYRRYARLASRVRVVDGRGSVDEVAARVLAEVRRGPA